MSLIRPASVAGLFYPSDPTELINEINHFFANAKTYEIKPKALIVPHAGYIYSGFTAAKAYNLLSSDEEKIKHIILIGPSHRVWVKGMAIPSSQFFETPLGQIKLDKESLNLLKKMPYVCISDDAHAQEHSLEVQLPFLQTVLNDFTLVPIVIGDTSFNDVAEVINLFISVPNTVIVISSDLSHFHNYQTAQTIDQKTSHLIETLNYTDIQGEMACGSTAIQGLLKSAMQHKLQVKKIDQCNSGDTAGDKNRVVGYASYAIF